jgi:MFS superfamily sulfate permease-like transporter
MITWIAIGIMVGLLIAVAMYRLKSASLSITFHHDNNKPLKGRKGGSTRKELED